MWYHFICIIRSLSACYIILHNRAVLQKYSSFCSILTKAISSPFISRNYSLFHYHKIILHKISQWLQICRAFLLKKKSKPWYMIISELCWHLHHLLHCNIFKPPSCPVLVICLHMNACSHTCSLVDYEALCSWKSVVLFHCVLFQLSMTEMTIQQLNFTA